MSCADKICFVQATRLPRIQLSQGTRGGDWWSTLINFGMPIFVDPEVVKPPEGPPS